MPDNRAIHRSTKRLLAAAASVLYLCTLAACSNSAEQSQTDPLRQMYETVIHDLVARSEAELTEAELETNWSHPVVYVDWLPTIEIPLELQVAVIEDLAEVYQIRFIDDMIEAVDTKLEGTPVDPGTLLIVFGELDVDGTDYLLHAEYYLSEDATGAYLYSFENRQAVSADRPGMVMAREPDPVDSLLEFSS